MKPGSLLAITFLSAVSVAHVLRFILRVEIVVDGVTVPLWPSLVAASASAGIAVLLWREVSRHVRS